MSETYDITYDSNPVGKARKEKLGLYYLFSCRCRLPDEGLYRIHVICGENRENLGICIPMEDMFGMDKKIPVKNIGSGDMVFHLVPKDRKQEEPAIVQEPEAVMPVHEPEETGDIHEPPAIEDVSQEEMEETFIPVSEDEPFEHLDKLEDAIMEIRGDEVGIILSATE